MVQTTVESIKEIQDFISSLNPKSKILVISDWDNCISLYNGCEGPLREGKKTENFFNFLNSKNIQWFIMTSRLNGKDFEGFGDFVKDHPEISKEKIKEKSYTCFMKMVDSMNEELPALNNLTNSLEDLNPPFPLEYKRSNIGSRKMNVYGLIYGNIVFAGSPKSSNSSVYSKANAISDLMVKRLIPSIEDLDYLIFIDDSKINCNKVTLKYKYDQIYSNRVYVFHYQQLPRSDSQNRKLCTRFVDMTDCMNSPQKSPSSPKTHMRRKSPSSPRTSTKRSSSISARSSPKKSSAVASSIVSPKSSKRESPTSPRSPPKRKSPASPRKTLKKGSPVSPKSPPKRKSPASPRQSSKRGSPVSPKSPPKRKSPEEELEIDDLFHNSWSSSRSRTQFLMSSPLRK
jgi:hypothetical protein